MARRWVRLQCDDPPEWVEIGWEGRTIVMHLMRVVDSQGAFFIGDLEPIQAMVDLIGLPHGAALRGMSRALARGALTMADGHLVIVGHAARQRHAANVAERKRKSRLRQRERALHEVTNRDMSQNVTPTNGHHAISAENGKIGHDVTLNVTGHMRDIVTSPIVRASRSAVSAEPPYEDDPGQLKLPSAAPWIRLLKVWERVSNKGLPCGDPHSHRRRLELLWVACQARDPADPEGVFRRAAEAYCEVQRKRGKTPLLQWFAADFEAYANVKNGRASSPALEELQRAEAAHAAAVKANAPDAGRLREQVALLSKRITGHA